MQKLIILSIVLLTTLSTTLLTEINITPKKTPRMELGKENVQLEKLKQFNVKNYWSTYRENKEEQNIRIDSIRRLEYLKNKERHY